jgi:HTH-type transcriptional regulator/antitoxin HigA
MEVRPIRTRDDHSAALRRIDALWGTEDGTPEGDELDILVTLVERYETKHAAAPHASPLEVLKFMMEQNDRTQKDLADLLGSRSRASEILNGKRELTLDQIRLLSARWRIPAAALVGELETTAT